MTNATGDVLQMQLQAAVRALRPEETPSALRVRIHAIPDASGRVGLLQRLLRSSPAALGVAALAAAAGIAVLAIGLNPGIVPPIQPGSPGTPGSHFDPTAEGAGILSDVFPSLVLVPGALAAVALLFAARSLRANREVRGWGHALRLALAAAVAGPSIFLAATPGFEWSSFYGPVQGLDVTVDAPPGSDGPPTWYETVNAGEPVVFAVGIQNRALIPIRFDGLVSANLSWTAITTRGQVDPGPGTLDTLAAFAPVVVQPGDWMELYIAAKAGPCVYGPDFVLDDEATIGYAARDRRVVLAYSVLGLQASAPIQLPINVVEPTRVDCPARQP